MSTSEPVRPVAGDANDNLAGHVERLYDDFRRYARTLVRGEDSMQATTVLHDALAKIFEGHIEFGGDRQLLALVSLKMRRIVIDRVRAKRAAKRGGEALKVPFDPERDQGNDERPRLDLVALDEALGKLRADPEQDRLWRIIELRFFAGLNLSEIAETLDVSMRTVERDWRFARAWLQRELDHDA